MNITEDKLSPHAKAVLAIARAEWQAGKLTTEQMRFINNGVLLQEALDNIGTFANFVKRFVLWLAAFVVGLATVWAYIGDYVEMLRKKLGV